MSKTLELTVTKRDIVGKKVSALRRDGLVVGNIFSKGKGSTAIQVEYELVRKMVDQAGFNHPINMKVEGAGDHLVLIKEIDRDPRTNRFHHIAFHEVRRDQKVEAEIPVELVGTSPAVLAGNIVLTLNDTVLVSANPMSLPDHFEADAAMLAEPDDNIQAKDLKLPSGVELVDDVETVLFKVDVPRSQVEEESETSEADAVAATLEASGESKESTDEN
jgi:large subunit ribosomal protein L25